MPDADPPVMPETADSARSVVYPEPGEAITSTATNNTYFFGDRIGEGHFGIVYACSDIWNNELAAKILKPTGPYEHVRAAAEDELIKLRRLRHPNITYVHDAFEFRDTFYIITERCFKSFDRLMRDTTDFHGEVWVVPLARCLLQAVHFAHINGYAHQDIHCGNVFCAFVPDELAPTEPGSLTFRLGDLGIAKLIGDLRVDNTRAEWMLPPEVLDTKEFGPIDHRVDIYHVGLLFLHVALGTEVRFTRDEILAGTPRERALQLPHPFSTALEKALRRHVPYRTASAMEMWRDLNAPAPEGAAGLGAADGPVVSDV